MSVVIKITAKDSNDKITWEGEVISKTVNICVEDMKEMIIHICIDKGYEDIKISSL